MDKEMLIIVGCASFVLGVLSFFINKALNAPRSRLRGQSNSLYDYYREARRQRIQWAETHSLPPDDSYYQALWDREIGAEALAIAFGEKIEESSYREFVKQSRSPADPPLS